MDKPTIIELAPDVDPPGSAPEVRQSSGRTLAALGLLVVAVGAAAWFAGGSADDRDDRAEPAPVAPPEAIPETLRAAETYAAAPSADGLRALLDSLGGLEGLQLGSAEGGFDVVSFNPYAPEWLLASKRSGYGPAQNQDLNQIWYVSEGTVAQAVWAPTTPHDFIHFNTDGTVTMWAHSGDEVGFAPRHATVFDRRGELVRRTSAPLYADRFAVDARTVFALTGPPEWYTPSYRYLALVADTGERQVELAPGETFGWIDVPTPGIVMAYPSDESGLTAVWDTTTLERLDDHVLAGRPYQRVAVSRDRTMALGVTFDGKLEPLDLSTGRTRARFGSIDVTGVGHPVALDEDGTIALTVDRSGAIAVWFVGDLQPVATWDASSAPAQWLPSSRSAAVTSVLAPDASRLARRVGAQPGVRLTWQIVDTDIGSWISRACTSAGRGLTELERKDLGLVASLPACP